MTLTAVVTWALAPLVWSALSLGAGLLVDAVTGRRLSGALLIPVGFALVVVAGTFTTAWPVLSPLTAPALVVLAAIGIFMGRQKFRNLRAAVPACVAALVVYLLYAMPALVSGAPFAGWIKLDDGSTWLAFSDRLIEAGRTTGGLAPSTYEAVLQINWDGAYPVGAFPPLGAVASMVHVDAAWLLQPYLAFLAAVLALTIYHLLGRSVANAALRTGLSVVAATPALLLGYSLWGGVKELALAPLLVLAAVLCAKRTSTTALAIVTAAVLCIAGFSGGVWVFLPLIVWLVLCVQDRAWRSLALFVGEVLVLAIPLLVLVRPEDVRTLAGFAAGSTDIGVLWGPLNRLQVLGIWPVGDFRATPSAMEPVLLLLLVVIVLAAIGIWQALHDRSWALPVYVGNVLLIAAVSSLGNAWIGGKALAMASPAPLVAAAAGIGWLWSQRRMVEAWVGVGFLAVGVAWSYALAYHEVWLAPAAQLRELQAIGADPALPAPALMLEYSPYGVRHFLRHLDAEGAGELRRRTIPTQDGGTVERAEYADVDEISQAGLADFPTLVLRRSVIASRPPSNYRLVRQGEFYEVWSADPAARRVVSHVPLGSTTEPAQIPRCQVVLDTAAAAVPGDSLAFVESPPVVTVPLGPSGTITPVASTTVTQSFDVAQDGSYDVGLGGSFTGKVTLKVDGKVVWSGGHQLNWTGNVTPAGPAQLNAGAHELTLQYEVNPLQPGAGSGPWPLGPVYVSLSDPDPAVQFVPPSQAKSLCGRRLDWLEVVR